VNAVANDPAVTAGAVRSTVAGEQTAAGVLITTHCPIALPANNVRVNISIKACFFMFFDFVELFLTLINEVF
jgi:hypothetical protein